MAYTLITRNTDSSPALKYTPISPLASGQAHSHHMPVPLILHAHEDGSPDPVEFVHLENHAHHVVEYKYHRHLIDSVAPISHTHEVGGISHKHGISYHDETYTYSVTRQTGADAPIVTPDVGTAAVIRVPGGASTADTENASIVFELEEGTNTCDTDQLTVGPSFDFGYHGGGGSWDPIYGPRYDTIEGDTDIVLDINIRLELTAVPEAKPVSTSAHTDAAMHKGVVGADKAVQTNANGDNNQAIMLDGTDSADGDILGTGSNGAEVYSDTYEKHIIPGIWEGMPQEPDYRYIYSPVHSGIAGWVLTRYDPAYEAGALGAVFYKLGTSPEGSWTPRPCGNSLSVNPDMGDIPSDSNFVGTYWLGTCDFMPYEQWWFGSYYFSYSVDTWYLANWYTGLGYKKVGSVLDPTGSYVGIPPNTGTYVVSSTPAVGNFKAAWKTLPELTYSPIKKAYHGQHHHGVTDTPTHTSLEHAHEDQELDYSHTHDYQPLTHVHVPSGADFEPHKHIVQLTDHSHKPVVFGIWRSVNILSNVTFKRVDDVSPWVLFAVDTVNVDYPSPTVGAEEADVEWPVELEISLAESLDSTSDLATDIDIAVGAIEGGTQEGTRTTNQVTIPDVPLMFGPYIAGSPELGWIADTETALAYHIGIGEAAGTSAEQSLFSPLDGAISVLVRNVGVLERMHVGRLPTGIVHKHNYTNAAFRLEAHPHSYHWHGDYFHVHKMYLSNPHSHPAKVVPTESHKHNVVECDATPHLHDAKNKTAASSFVVGVDNVVDDTFDEDIDTSKTVLYMDSTGSDNGAETGVAAVSPADNALSVLHVVSAVDPTLDGDYQKRFTPVNGWDYYYVSWVKIGDPTKTFGDNSRGWYVLNGVAYRFYWDGPVGNYKLWNDPNVYAVVTDATIMGVKNVDISKDITTSTEKKFVPHKRYGQGAYPLGAYIWDWAAAAGSPVLSSYDTAGPNEFGSLQADDGEVDFTMTGVVDDKVHEGI